MYRFARNVLWGAVLTAVSVPAAARGSGKMTVSEQIVTHPMWVCPMKGDSPYPVPAPAEPVRQARQKLKQREKQIEESLLEARPELKDDKQARRRAVREMLGKDVQYRQLREKLNEAKRSHWRKVDHTFPMITLNNGLVELKIGPTLGMRVVNAVDLATGQSFALTEQPRRYETEPFKDVIGWDAGYVETSFPYFEHGMFVRQPGGYRIVRRRDGSVTVAMNCRFTQFQHRRHMGRYGHYSQRTLSTWVTLRPAQSRFRLTTRVDNPNPLRRSNRCWTNQRLVTEQYDGKHIIYPAGYVMPHGGGSAKPFRAAGGEPQWQGVSHFALYTDYGFCGVYSPRRNVNTLIYGDPQSVPGLKLYTPGGQGGFMELWRGSNVLFEDPGQFLDPYVPIEYALDYYVVGGIGRVDFANRNVAVAEDNGSFSLVAPVPGQCVVKDSAGKVVAEGPVGPGREPLTGQHSGRILINIDGRQVADVGFPLRYTDTRPRLLKEVKGLGGKFRPELEENTNHRGAPTCRSAVPAARKVVDAGEAPDAARALSLANTCYRQGYFDLALKLVELAGPAPQGDHLRGLIAWERGEKDIDFRRAGLDAHYHRALLAVQEHNKKRAVALLDQLISKRPDVYRPRLLRAYLKRDRTAAEKLAEENPASPEAQLVLELLGDRQAGQAKESLLENNPDAEKQVEAFEKELTEGKWSHRRRYEPFAP